MSKPCGHCNGTGLDTEAHWPEGFRERMQHEALVAAARTRLNLLQYGWWDPVDGIGVCPHGMPETIPCLYCDRALVDHGTPRRCELRPETR